MSSFKPTIIFALGLAMMAAPSVDAHGRLIRPAALVNNDVRVNANNPCGTRNVAGSAANAAAERVTPGQPATFTWRIRNGDGAGPLTARVDPTGTGKSFDVPLTVRTQIPGQRGRLQGARNQEARFTVDIPASLQCNPTCLMQVTQPVGFGSCGVLTTGGQGAGTAGDGNGQAAAASGAANQGKRSGNLQSAAAATGGARRGRRAGRRQA